LIGSRAFKALLLIVFLAGCSKVSDTTTAPGAETNAWTRPGVLTYAEAQDPALLDPILAASSPISRC
jgi:PBP1b-binding outer membrane lipoprotein LpoB